MTTRKPKAFVELTTDVAESKPNKLKTTQDKADSEQRLSDIIGEKMLMLAQARERGRIDLQNIDDVEAATMLYFESCRKKGNPPNFEGLAAWLGYSRQNLYYIIKSRNDDVSEFLDNCRTLFADIIQTASSKRLLDNATSIFILKSMTGLGFTDKNDELPEMSEDPVTFSKNDGSYKDKYRKVISGEFD